ncbi:unnamed protein product [Leuciscus chuanchicus]
MTTIPRVHCAPETLTRLQEAGREAGGYLATDCCLFEVMEKQTKKNICSLDDFIQAQGLVDWPVTCEENLDESSSHLYRHSGEIYEDLKARVPFPSESLQKDLQRLWIKLTLQNSIFSRESGAPAVCVETSV